MRFVAARPFRLQVGRENLDRLVRCAVTCFDLAALPGLRGQLSWPGVPTARCERTLAIPLPKTPESETENHLTWKAWKVHATTALNAGGSTGRSWRDQTGLQQVGASQRLRRPAGRSAEGWRPWLTEVGHNGTGLGKGSARRMPLRQGHGGARLGCSQEAFRSCGHTMFATLRASIGVDALLEEQSFFRDTRKSSLLYAERV